MPELGKRIKECRESAQLTQLQVSTALRVPRELISMWESDSRVPNVHQLEQVATLLGTTAQYLLDGKKSSLSEKPALQFRGRIADPSAQLAVENWLKFLDHWSELVAPTRQTFSQPPTALKQAANITDLRKASLLAASTREHFQLGNDPITDMYAFLDDHNILVVQAKLGKVEGNKGISGAFYNHPKLGWCILSNAEVSFGRQKFTLAHEFAHALFHYHVREPIISSLSERNPEELFADAFAGHFLIPSKTLKTIVHQNDWGSNLDAYKSVALASVFGVSYGFMLLKLMKEELITSAQKEQWIRFSPTELGKHMGINTHWFKKPKADHLAILDADVTRFPITVLARIRDLVEDEELTASEAAKILSVDELTLKDRLLTLPKAQAHELEHEYAF